MVVLRSQCEFIDRDPNHGLIFSLGNIATRLHVTHSNTPFRAVGEDGGDGDDDDELDASHRHDKFHHGAMDASSTSSGGSSVSGSGGDDFMQQQQQLRGTAASGGAHHPLDGTTGLAVGPPSTAAFKLRKLEVVLLTAVLRFRVGVGAASTLRDVITLPNCKLRMLTQQPLLVFEPNGNGVDVGNTYVVDIVEYITQWDNRIKLSTDIRLYERLKVMFSNLSTDLKSRSTHSEFGRARRAHSRRRGDGLGPYYPGGVGAHAGGSTGAGVGSSQHANNLHQRAVKMYGFDGCVIKLNPQVDVLKGLTPSFGQVLVQLGSSTRKFVSGTDSIVRRRSEQIARVICQLSNTVDGALHARAARQSRAGDDDGSGSGSGSDNQTDDPSTASGPRTGER